MGDVVKDTLHNISLQSIQIKLYTRAVSVLTLIGYMYAPDFNPSLASFRTF